LVAVVVAVDVVVEVGGSTVAVEGMAAGMIMATAVEVVDETVGKL
jgi:hypothetical protein